jgi:hypothetical protein
MSNHLTHIEILISAAQEFLYLAQREEAPDIEMFYQIQVEQKNLLDELGPVSVNHPQVSMISSRMEYLVSLNEEVALVIQKLMQGIKVQLAQNQTHRKTLTGYQQSVLTTSQKGIWRGQG